MMDDFFTEDQSIFSEDQSIFTEAQSIFTEAHSYLNNMYELFTDAIGSLEVPVSSRILRGLVAVFLFFLIYRVLGYLAGNLRSFVGVFCQFLLVFSACHLAQTVYNDPGQVVEYLQIYHDGVRSWF